jgi:hypothetical protein
VCPQFNSAGRHFSFSTQSVHFVQVVHEPAPRSKNRLDFHQRDGFLRVAEATVAQLVEQSIRNRQVSGSIPLGGFDTCPLNPDRFAWLSVSPEGWV